MKAAAAVAASKARLLEAQRKRLGATAGDLINDSAVATPLYINITDDLLKIELRAFALLSATPPNGGVYCTVLRKLLDRENNWIVWKHKNCAPFERFSTAKGSDGPEGEANAESKMDLCAEKEPKKRTTELENENEKEMENKKEKGKISATKVKRDYIFDVDGTLVNKIAQKIVEKVPKFEEYIEEFREADDPENGVEEEYHPKRNQVVTMLLPHFYHVFTILLPYHNVVKKLFPCCHHGNFMLLPLHCDIISMA